jgi:hypothetical protein
VIAQFPDPGSILICQKQIACYFAEVGSQYIELATDPRRYRCGTHPLPRGANIKHLYSVELDRGQRDDTCSPEPDVLLGNCYKPLIVRCRFVHPVLMSTRVKLFPDLKGKGHLGRRAPTVPPDKCSLPPLCHDADLTDCLKGAGATS